MWTGNSSTSLFLFYFSLITFNKSIFVVTLSLCLLVYELKSLFPMPSCSLNKFLLGENFLLLSFTFLILNHVTMAFIEGNKTKGESQNGCFKKTKAKFSKKNEHLLLPDTHKYVCVSGGKKCSFSENLACLVFLKNPFWDSTFCLITDDIQGDKLFAR